MADLSITAASVVRGSNALVENGIAGATITQGKTVYKEAASGQYKLADSDSATAEANAVYGIALNSASSGQPLTVQTGGDITIGATLTVGADYFLSETAGGIQPGADVATAEKMVALGYAISATVLRLRIQNLGIAKP